MPGFGEATFVQAAGFLKIADGDNPLDATWIHPESYEVARQVLEKLGCSTDRSAAERNDRGGRLKKSRSWKAKPSNWPPIGTSGLLTLRDILAQLTRPGRDPREDLPPPIFKRGIFKLDDLQPGMELTGTVLNVVDFGAFVDIGLHDSGLVHVSQLANRYRARSARRGFGRRHRARCGSMEIDKTRRRVSLTMIPPGTPKHEPRPRPARGESRTTRERRRRSPPRRDRRPRSKRQPRQGVEQPVAASQAPAQGKRLATVAPAAASDGPAPVGFRSTTAAAKANGRGDRRSGPRMGSKVGDSKVVGRSRASLVSSPARSRSETEADDSDHQSMKEGKEPLRTFSDLFQFVEIQSTKMNRQGRERKTTVKPRECRSAKNR